LTLVDDHTIVRSGLRWLLTALPNVQISEAATGEEARTERPALIVLDLNLPGLGGLELVRRVLAEHPDGRVIVLSMHAEALYATRALPWGPQAISARMRRLRSCWKPCSGWPGVEAMSRQRSRRRWRYERPRSATRWSN
jgi:DNA-binding NarL/FixJ family response regulator